MRTPIKFWVCGCVTLFYKSEGTNIKPNLGFLLHKCRQCKTAEPILAELLAEERAVVAAMEADAAYRLQAQGTPEQKLDIYG
jgi:hypothetical protein